MLKSAAMGIYETSKMFVGIAEQFNLQTDDRTKLISIRDILFSEKSLLPLQEKFVAYGKELAARDKDEHK